MECKDGKLNGLLEFVEAIPLGFPQLGTTNSAVMLSGVKHLPDLKDQSLIRF